METLEKEKLTYEEIDKLPEGSYEIIDGEIVEMAPTGFEHGRYEGKLFSFLDKKLKNKGYVAVGEVGILISKDPLRIRGADVVYISKEKTKDRPTGILEIAPDLVIEIVSPNNTLKEMEEKIEDFFKIGVPKVILIEPYTEKVFVYENGKREIKVFKFNENVEFVEGVKARIKDIVEQ